MKSWRIRWLSWSKMWESISLSSRDIAWIQNLLVLYLHFYVVNWHWKPHKIKFFRADKYDSLAFAIIWQVFLFSNILYQVLCLSCSNWKMLHVWVLDPSRVMQKIPPQYICKVIKVEKRLYTRLQYKVDCVLIIEQVIVLSLKLALWTRQIIEQNPFIKEQ